MNKFPVRSKRWKMLVTPAEACAVLGTLPASLKKEIRFFPTTGRVSDADKLALLLSDKDAVVLDLEPITEKILGRCAALKVISRFGEGCDAIDIAAAKRSGVRVARTRGVSAKAVARHTMALIMAMAHNIRENDSRLKRGIWLRGPNMPVSSSTLAIIGFGRIGRAVAELAHQFGFRIVVYARHCHADKRFTFVRNVAEAVSAAEIVSLHLPLTPETEHLLSGRLLKQCRGKIIINTARGALIDEGGLLRALQAGAIKGYATDVFLREPVKGISKRLAKHSLTLCSPHIAAFDRATAADMTRRAVENALHSLKHEHNRVMTYVER